MKLALHRSTPRDTGGTALGNIIPQKRPVDETGLKDDDAFPFRMLLDYNIKEGHGSGLRGPRWR